MHDLVFDQTDNVVLHKLSSFPSQTSMQELLREFVSSDMAEVCVLVANLQEASCKTINHIRVMIEEEELKNNTEHCKLFVLLLHFPPAKFFQHCYPALFLKGWDHVYLDTIAHNAKDVVEVQDWFVRSCFPAEELNLNDSDTLLQSLSQLLHIPPVISAISSRVQCGSKSDGSFNSIMNATQRSNALMTLLFERGLGDVLCEKFRAYWKPKIMVEYLERAAKFSTQRESTLNITDYIQTEVKELFIFFCIYMLTQINENYNLDIIYDKETPSSICKLFLDVFRAICVSELFQIIVHNANLPALQPPEYCSHFPFFMLIYTLMEKQVELSGEAANLQLNIFTDNSHHHKNMNSKLQALVEAVSDNLKSQLHVKRHIIKFLL